MTSPNHLSSDIVASIPTGLLIGGEWRPAASTFAVHDPATTEVITEIGNGTAADGIAALDAAAESFAAWRAVAPREKAELLRAVFDRLIAQADVAAAIVTAEGGKPLAESRAEVAYAAEYIRWYSEQAVRLGGLARKAPGGANHQLVLSKPVGPALLITPWNFPIAMITRKIAPALAAGCPVVIKPAQLTPLTTQWVAELFRSELERRGLPTGVINVVPTSSSRALTEPIIADPRLRKISFTGSTEVGRTLLRQAATGVLRTSMELGGNAPFLVFDDADIPAAVAGAVAAKMRNAGQTCVAANRFIVQAGVAEEFAAQLTVAFDQLVVGHGAAAGTTVGPLIESSAVDHVESLVTAAVADGATVRTGGARPDLPGYFYSPTVISGVTPESLVATDEVFGPVAPIITFGTEAEGVAIANGTEFGLAGYAFTRDISRAMRLTDELEVGILGINRGMVSDASAPFGGVKSSGLGREGGEAGIEDYLEHMYVAL